MDVKTTRLAQKLSVILEQEATILAGVRDLLTHETTSLARMDAAEVVAHTKKKELLILQQTYLEHERLRLLRRLSESGRHDTTPPLCLGDLIEQADGPLRDKLRGLHEQLYGLVAEIQTRSATNNRLLGFMLQTLEGSIAFLTLAPKTTSFLTDAPCSASSAGPALALATG